MKSALYSGTLSHARGGDKPYAFRHRVYFAAIDLAELPALSRELRLFSHNHRNLFSLFDRDYQERPNFARVVLVTQLRVLGYVFNPVSFFYCYNAAGALTCIIPEVKNTYGGTHRYLLDETNQVPGKPHFRTPKAFYVSPFIGDDYTYEWRFPSAAAPLADIHDVQMRLYDAAGARYFATRLRGRRRPLSDARLLLSFARFPMLPAQIITLIHLHAFRLRARGLQYRRPPHVGTGTGPSH